MRLTASHERGEPVSPSCRTQPHAPPLSHPVESCLRALKRLSTERGPSGPRLLAWSCLPCPALPCPAPAQIFMFEGISIGKAIREAAHPTSYVLMRLPMTWGQENYNVAPCALRGGQSRGGGGLASPGQQARLRHGVIGELSTCAVRRYATPCAAVRHRAPPCATVRHRAPPCATERRRAPPCATVRHRAPPPPLGEVLHRPRLAQSLYIRVVVSRIRPTL